MKALDLSTVITTPEHFRICQEYLDKHTEVQDGGCVIWTGYLHNGNRPSAIIHIDGVKHVFDARRLFNYIHSEGRDQYDFDRRIVPQYGYDYRTVSHVKYRGEKEPEEIKETIESEIDINDLAHRMNLAPHDLEYLPDHGVLYSYGYDRNEFLAFSQAYHAIADHYDVQIEFEPINLLNPEGGPIFFIYIMR